MGQRFFVETDIDTAIPVVLSGQEARHLSRVMRAAPGDQVVLFDGRGAEYVARVVEITKSDVSLEIVAREETSREPAISITLGVALPKGERQRWLVEKATELGVATLAPLITDRGVAQPTPQALERLRRAVIAASKQCGRNRLMEIAAPRTCSDHFAAAPAAAARWLAHPTSNETRPPACEATSVWLAVGPEGGFNQREVEEALRNGWTQVALGARLLRTETAAVALAAHVMLASSS